MKESFICVDANVVVWSLVPAPLTDKAQELLKEAHAKQLTLVSPSLLAFEVASTLRRLVYLRAISAGEGEEAFAIFSRIPIRFSQRRGIVPLAWQLTKQYNRPRAYDTAYMAVAELYSCDLWTADERLYNAVENRVPWVKWLGDYAKAGS
jgi:predicted nucleic acid-binding protein